MKLIPVPANVIHWRLGWFLRKTLCTPAVKGLYEIRWMCRSKWTGVKPFLQEVVFSYFIQPLNSIKTFFKKNLETFRRLPYSKHWNQPRRAGRFAFKMGISDGTWQECRPTVRSFTTWYVAELVPLAADPPVISVKEQLLDVLHLVFCYFL